MSLSPLIQQLIEALRCLPGVGPKSAQRMAFHLLEHNRQNGVHLANIMAQAIQHVGHCQSCRTLTEDALCPLCNNNKRDQSLLCVVETPADISAIEQTGGYRGLYFVLMGNLSPLDGIGPEQLGIDLLKQKLANTQLREVILATNTTVEGEATAHYIADLVKRHQISVTRLAHGIPLGGELEFVDGSTLAHAFNGRQPVEI